MNEADEQAVRLDRQGEVLVLSIAAGPDTSGAALRANLAEGIAQAAEDQAIGAVVVSLDGAALSADCDLRDAGTPTLAALCRVIEACPKPVIAALEGVVLGGWLELALAAPLRIAVETAEVGFPEVHLGLLPGAGATQRLPRLIGAEQALRLLLEGRPVGVTEALAMGLIDGVVEEGLAEAALALARDIGDPPPTPTTARRDGMRDPVAYQAAVTRAREKHAGGRLPAPERIVDCVEAALLLSPDQGFAFEAAALAELTEGPESAALRHLARAERRASDSPEARVAALPVRTAGVLGCGEAASDWAFALLGAGVTVTLVGTEREGLVVALERIAAQQEIAVQDGQMTAEARDADWARLTPTLSEAALAGLDVAFDAGEGPMVALVGDTPLVLHPGAGRLVEVEGPPGAPAQAVATLLSLLRRMGRGTLCSAGPVGAPVLRAGQQAAEHLRAQGVAGDLIGAALERFGLPAMVAPGGGSGRPAAEIVARVLGAMANAGARLVEAGTVARPSDVDLALVRGQGFPAWEGGPMLWADRRGLLVVRRDLRLWADEVPELWQPALLFDDLIRDGRGFGSRNG